MTWRNGFSRRDFLKAAGAAAGPVILGNSLFAGERAAAGNRITIGCIGIGNMGNADLDAFLGNRDVQVLAVCDVDTKKRESARAKVEGRYAAETRSGRFSGCAACNDFRELLARDDIDAVQITTPDHWHAIMAVQAAAAGKDIYCEKPLSLTVRQAEAMVQAVRRHGRVLQTGSQQRSDGRFRLACELVRNGRIGQVTEVYVSVGGPSADCYEPEQPVPPGLDWDLWLGPAPWAPYNAERSSGSFSGGWRRFRDYSGGMMTDWGAHHFDIAQWGLGRDGDGPVEIIPPDGKEHRLLTYRYADGVRMYHGGGPRQGQIQFVGTEGTIGVDRGFLGSWPETIVRRPLSADDLRLYRSPGHHQDFINCVKTRRRPICDVEIGASSVTVCHLGNIAYWVGRPIRWDPAKREIIGDAEAARWLDRPKRAPWTL